MNGVYAFEAKLSRLARGLKLCCSSLPHSLGVLGYSVGAAGFSLRAIHRHLRLVGPWAEAHGSDCLHTSPKPSTCMATPLK